jgi:transposase
MASARSDSVVATRFAAEAGMMGRLNHDQGQLFYSFSLEEAVPDDHLVREIAAVLDLAWVRVELAPYYSSTGRPSIDPELMIRMLIIGYVFAIRSERALCRDVQVNFAYRWFCGLSIEDKVPDHSAFSRARNDRFRDSDIFRSVFERVVNACIRAGRSGSFRILILSGTFGLQQRLKPTCHRRLHPTDPIAGGLCQAGRR